MSKALNLTLGMALFTAALAGGCSSESKKSAEAKNQESAAAPTATPPQALEASLKAASGSKVKGTVQFMPETNGVRVVANLEGLKPNSKHGFHIHDKGDCSDPKFKSAGDHWNPDHKKHGGPDSPEHHAGDLGNIKADATGHASLDQVVGWLKGSEMAISGRSVVLHQKADDLKTQPSGNSGDRIACGVIEPVKH